MSTLPFSLTSIGGKKCTALPKIQNAHKAQTRVRIATSSSFYTATTPTSTPELHPESLPEPLWASFPPSSPKSRIAIRPPSLPTALPPPPPTLLPALLPTSLATSPLTSFSSSPTPVSASTLASAPLTEVLPPKASTPDSFTSTQVTLASSTTSSASSSQSVLPIVTLPHSATQTGAPALFETVPVSLETRTPITSSLIISSSQTGNGLSPTEQTNHNSIPTTTSESSLVLPASTTGVAVGDAATWTTTTAARTGTGIWEAESSSVSENSTDGFENNTGSGISAKTSAAIVGGVIGGLAAVSIMIFLIWLARKRLAKNRHSALLNSLPTDASHGGGEKGSYFIYRDSMGPATMLGKMRAAVGYNYHRLCGGILGLMTSTPKLRVNMDRGNSQFDLTDTQDGRSTFGAGIASSESASPRDWFAGWRGRQTEGGIMSWRPGIDPELGGDPYSCMSGALPSTARANGGDRLQPGVRKNALAATHPRRSRSLGSYNYFSYLGLDLDPGNPFADSNAMSHDSAMVLPLTLTKATNVLSGANAVASQGRLAVAKNANSNRNTGVSAARTYRSSSVSVETFDTRRNKFRSDPFDLDRPDLLARYSNARGMPHLPLPTHARPASFTSKYSSGGSALGGWGDPGPDVGPGAGWWNMSMFPGALEDWSTKSGWPRGSVGKAI